MHAAMPFSRAGETQLAKPDTPALPLERRSGGWHFGAAASIALILLPSLVLSEQPVGVPAGPDATLASLLPFPLAPGATLRIPGSSRFAGEYEGASDVYSALAALCAPNTGTVSGAQQFSADSVAGAILLLRSAPDGHRRSAWHEVLVYRLDDARRMRSIELYMEDQRAWDRRFPREDGVRRVSVATERNVALTRGREPRARFVAGNGDHVLVVYDQGFENGALSQARARTLLVQYTFTPAGEIRARSTFAPTSTELFGVFGAR